jgi:hypothetical protein
MPSSELSSVISSSSTGLVASAIQPGMKIRSDTSFGPELMGFLQPMLDKALFKATRCNNPAAVQQALESGASIDALHNGMTVLHLAVWLGFEPIVRCLLVRDVNLERKVGRQQSKTMLQLPSTDDSSQTNASAGGLQEADNLQSFSPTGMTALHIATARKQESILQLLLSNRADVRATVGIDNQTSDLSDQYWGMTPLHIAVAHKSEQITRFLLDSGANIEARIGPGANEYKLGMTALHMATFINTESIFTLLVNRGADISARITSNPPRTKPLDGYTALHIAAKYDVTGIARELLRRGADPLARDVRGRVPLDEIRNQHSSTVDVLKSAITRLK